MAEPNEIKRMDIKEFREQGYLHEVNRLILHPLGLALEVNIAEDGTETLGGVWDCREDPEGIHYGDDLLSADKATRVSQEIEKRGADRVATLGYVVQPLPEDVKQLHTTIKEPIQESDLPYLRFAGAGVPSAES